MNQLGDALEKAKFTPDDITKLRSFSDLCGIRNVVRGLRKIVMIKHVIDCDADPFLPGRCKVKSHKKGGQLEWDSDKINLYISKNQKNDLGVRGYNLRAKLANEPVLNANVLDYLISHPELIPQEWKDKTVYFWGTIYRDSADNPFVRCFVWDGSKWCWRYGWFHGWFNSQCPAALLAT